MGTLPPEIATDDVLSAGRAGQYNAILAERTGCTPWGETIPLSGGQP